MRYTIGIIPVPEEEVPEEELDQILMQGFVDQVNNNLGLLPVDAEDEAADADAEAEDDGMDRLVQQLVGMINLVPEEMGGIRLRDPARIVIGDIKGYFSWGLFTAMSMMFYDGINDATKNGSLMDLIGKMSFLCYRLCLGSIWFLLTIVVSLLTFMGCMLDSRIHGKSIAGVRMLVFYGTLDLLRRFSYIHPHVLTGFVLSQLFYEGVIKKWLGRPGDMGELF